MKSPIFFLAAILSLFVLTNGCSDAKSPEYTPAEGPLYTQWAAGVVPATAWQEYPRPQMVREEWLNLNGMWDYAIVSKDDTPEGYDGQILVPFPVESSLSGVGKRLDASQAIWYRKEIGIPAGWSGKKTLLHIEASDWETSLWVDGQLAGTHRGGYDPFTFDITDLVQFGAAHTLTLKVWDPTDDGYQPRGKQVSDPRGIWYTPSSGIWQTIWLEPVSESYIKNFYLTTDIDEGKVWIRPDIENTGPDAEIELSVTNNGRQLVLSSFAPEETMEISIPDAELWSPDHPHLYGLRIRLMENGEVTDEVDSYFGMRKISIVKDKQGYNRLALNNEILFQNGPLDQGFWPDGLNTPPSDEAMKYDIEATRAMGFNMLRKHVKVENRRFYHWCDKIGILVWQDMPSAAGFIAPDDEDLQPSEEHKSKFEQELKQLVLTHFNHPSIVMWVPFNEGWGQYDTERIVNMVRALDSSRLVNNASGWSDRGVGDVIDIHHYPDPRCPDPEEDRASVLGEFGGLGLYVEGHTWQQENWGYEKLQAVDELLEKYEDYYTTVRSMEKDCGLAAVVYTQTTDVESETNGLMTYDRDRIKMGAENILKAHQGIIPPRIGSPLRKFIETVEVELIAPDPDAAVQYCLYVPGREDKWKAYEGAVEMSAPFTMKTRSLWPDGRQSRENTYSFHKATPFPAVNIKMLPGLHVDYYTGNWDSLPEFTDLAHDKEGLTKMVNLDFADTTQLFGLVFEGYLDVPETDVYLFHLSSDDGARMYLNGEALIDYDGIHGAGFRKASAALEKGLHPFRLVYFQRYGGLGLNLFWESHTMKYQEIGAGNWKH